MKRVTEVFLILTIDDDGFPKISDSLEERPSDDTMCYYLSNYKRVVVAQVTLNASIYVREQLKHT